MLGFTAIAVLGIFAETHLLRYVSRPQAGVLVFLIVMGRLFWCRTERSS